MEGSRREEGGVRGGGRVGGRREGEEEFPLISFMKSFLFLYVNINLMNICLFGLFDPFL